MERTAEPKVVLLVRLLNAIDEGRHSFEQLKDRIAERDARRPSTRSLRRYLAILSAAEFPWYFDRKANAYRFPAGYSLKRMRLSEGELFGLVALRSIAHAIGGAIGSSMGGLADKLALGNVRSGDGATPMAFRLSNVSLDEKAERVFSLLSAAERRSRSVRFAYVDNAGKRSTRTADPYGFVVNLGRVYCIAYDHARKERRSFAVDGIDQVDTLGATFSKPSEFDLERWAGSSISGVLHGGPPVDVRVRFSSRVARAAIAARLVERTEVSRHADGSVDIVFHVDDADELLRWVLGWGDEAEVMGPGKLRTRIGALASSISRKYDNRKR